MRRKNHGATLARDAENDPNPGDRLMLGIIAKLIKKIFGSHQERALKVLWQRVQVINEWYEKFDSLSDDEIKAKTWEFRARLQQGETLDDILPEAFAAVKQACKRNVGQRWMAAGMPFEWVEIPYDVQLRSAAWCCTWATSPKWRPAKARPWWLPCLCTSTRSRGAGATWPRSTTCWPSATANGPVISWNGWV
jgi:hypothetical protein